MGSDILGTCYDCCGILGLDPGTRGLTLRKLVRMAKARRGYEGGLTAWHACAVVAFMPFTGKRLNPGAVNPYRDTDSEAEKKLEEVRRFLAWRQLTVRAQEAFEAAGLI